MWILDILSIIVAMIPGTISALMAVNAFTSDNPNEDSAKMFASAFFMFIFSAFLLSFLRSCIHENFSIWPIAAGIVFLALSIVYWLRK